MPLYENLLYSMALLAMVVDLKTETIPNEGICLFWGTGLAYRIARDGWAGAAGWFWGAVLPVLLLAALFLPRMIGAGDIKLLSALGGMMGVCGGRQMYWDFFFSAERFLAPRF